MAPELLYVTVPLDVTAEISEIEIVVLMSQLKDEGEYDSVDELEVGDVVVEASVCNEFCVEEDVTVEFVLF